ncbi:MAG: hypothetical protein HYY76_04755 [Acidobacteria bacterium]|nr:hypothetical protein [Acidobacteriota bacterium]
MFTLVKHVRWELPFPLRLPPQAFLGWEPLHRVAAVCLIPGVGALQWKRQCSFLQRADVFVDPGPEPSDDEFPSHNYRLASLLARNGREVLTLELTGGRGGGFEEARPHSTANVFLVLTSQDSTNDTDLVNRAAQAINNFITLVAFMTLDGMSRPMNGDLDSYYTVISTARVPEDLGCGTAEEVLLGLDRLTFSSIVGEGRSHKVGMNSFEDLMPGAAIDRPPLLPQFVDLVRDEQRFELWHQLFWSSLRRLKRREYALAILDAESAFEVCVALTLRDALQRQGLTAEAADAALAADLGRLQDRLVRLDRIAQAEGATERFIGSQAERNWRHELYDVRHDVVHHGIRELTFDVSKAGISRGLQAVERLLTLTPTFRRNFLWTQGATTLAHLRESAGRVSRLFEL